MELIYEGNADSLTVGILGEITAANCLELRQGIEEAAARRPARLVLNLAGVTFLDTAGMSALLSLRVDLAQKNVTLALADPSPWVHRTLRTARLLDLFGLAGEAPPV